MVNADAKPPVLSVEGYSKSFGTVMANNDISFDLHRGEVLCLLGENGAGKSTLCKCLYGAYKPDCGVIRVNGEEVTLNSPRDAIDHRIGMVHQHFVLVPPLSVVENIVVGSEKKGFFSRLEPARRKVKELCGQYGLDIDPDAKIRDLSVGEQQWVEILKSMYSGVDVLILDEPTATLTPQETERLFSVVKKMVSQGMAVILITHKLHEVLGVSDRVVVLKKGEVSGTCITAESSKEDLVRLMVGRNVEFAVNQKEFVAGESSLELRNVNQISPFGNKILDDLALEVHQGEILGLAGIAGNGQAELFDFIAGIGRDCTGSIRFGSRDMSRLNPAQRSEMGLAQIPPDRIEQGLLMNFPLSENMILGHHRSSRFSDILLSSRRISEFARDSILNFDIACEGPCQRARELSGGNLQKVILARELSRDVRIVIASSPTRGLDVGAIEYVHKRLLTLRDGGAAVLLISEDLDEIMNLSDRISVIFKGRILDTFSRADATREKIGLLMAGVKENAS